MGRGLDTNGFIESFTLIEDGDVFNAGMRQQSLSGKVVNNFDELCAVADAAKLVFDDLLVQACRGLAGVQPKTVGNKGWARASQKARDAFSARLPGPPLAWLERSAAKGGGRGRARG